MSEPKEFISRAIKSCSQNCEAKGSPVFTGEEHSIRLSGRLYFIFGESASRDWQVAVPWELDSALGESAWSGDQADCPSARKALRPMLVLLGPAGHASYAPRPPERAEEVLVRGWCRRTRSTGALEVMRSSSHDLVPCPKTVLKLF
jgi:hypothetical protein